MTDLPEPSRDGEPRRLGAHASRTHRRGEQRAEPADETAIGARPGDPSTEAVNRLARSRTRRLSTRRTFWRLTGTGRGRRTIAISSAPRPKCRRSYRGLWTEEGEYSDPRQLPICRKDAHSLRQWKRDSSGDIERVRAREPVVIAHILVVHGSSVVDGYEIRRPDNVNTTSAVIVSAAL